MCWECEVLIGVQGEWRDDSQNGKGLWTFPSGQVYHGGLRNGLYHGHGTIKFSNGRRQSLQHSPLAIFFCS